MTFGSARSQSAVCDPWIPRFRERICEQNRSGCDNIAGALLVGPGAAFLRYRGGADVKVFNASEGPDRAESFAREDGPEEDSCDSHRVWR